MRQAAFKDKPVRRGARVSRRKLRDLRGIGLAMLKDFELLSVGSVEQLASEDGDALYRRLSQLTGVRQDPCVLDTFRCAVAQARNPALPADQTNWWYWSRIRKSTEVEEADRA